MRREEGGGQEEERRSEKGNGRSLLGEREGKEGVAR